MSMRRPETQITLAGRALSGPQAGIRAISVTLGTGSAHDAFRVDVWPGSSALQAVPGDTAEIAIGYDGSPIKVLTGTVTAVQRTQSGGTLEGLAGTAVLSGSRVARSFVRVEVGKIVSDLVKAAGATGGVIDAPIKLSAFHVDESRTIWTHVQALAELSGSAVSAGADGSLNFQPVKAAATTPPKLRYGAEVVSWELERRDPEKVPFDVMAPGAASEDGEEKWHLLTKEPEGSTPSKPVRFTAALADKESASAQAKAIAGAAKRAARRGTVVVVGDSSVRPGDVVEVDGLPNAAGGAFRVTALSHELAAESGFHTRLTVEAAP